jgi:hypothetical protein
LRPLLLHLLTAFGLSCAILKIARRKVTRV